MEIILIMMVVMCTCCIAMAMLIIMKNQKSSTSTTTTSTTTATTTTTTATTTPSTTTTPPSTTLTGCPVGWTRANGTLYSSWPKPGSKECVAFSGCKWAGQFSSISATAGKGKCAKGAKMMSGGNGTPKACRFTPETVKSMRMASTSSKDFAKFHKKTVEVMIEGRPEKVVKVVVRDKCSDTDCKDDNCGGTYAGCCAKHSDNYKYTLLDLEANPASELLGVDLTQEDVGGPFQESKMPTWALNTRAGLPTCVAGFNTMPLCYRVSG